VVSTAGIKNLKVKSKNHTGMFLLLNFDFLLY